MFFGFGLEPKKKKKSVKNLFSKFVHYNTSVVLNCSNLWEITLSLTLILFAERFVAKVKKKISSHYITTCYKDTHESDWVPVSWLSLNVCTTRTDGHESKAFWCGKQHWRGSDAPPALYNARSRQEGATGQQLSQELRHCKAVGRTQGAASLLPEL